MDTFLANHDSSNLLTSPVWNKIVLPYYKHSFFGWGVGGYFIFSSFLIRVKAVHISNLCFVCKICHLCNVFSVKRLPVHSLRIRCRQNVVSGTTIHVWWRGFNSMFRQDLVKDLVTGLCFRIPVQLCVCPAPCCHLLAENGGAVGWLYSNTEVFFFLDFTIVSCFLLVSVSFILFN